MNEILKIIKYLLLNIFYVTSNLEVKFIHYHRFNVYRSSFTNYYIIFENVHNLKFLI